jgi:hypothetical protein
MFRPVFVAAAAVAILCLPSVLAVEKSSAEPQVRAAVPVSHAGTDLNALVLEAAQGMPSGGTYSASKKSFDGLSRAATVNSHGLAINPEAAQPSFCSGATYIVFLQVIDRLQRQGALSLDRETLATLPVSGQRDGQGVWGRWNANGPGTARLFAELGLGHNFTSYADARPGDFMKVFWTNEIGRKEHGHSVIFLGCLGPGGEYVKYWSSNLPREKGDLSGYGVKLVARSKIARCIFSRLEQPANLARIRSVPTTDPFLASLLTRASDFDEVRRMCGF